jgi:hypothetical protein
MRSDVFQNSVRCQGILWQKMLGKQLEKSQPTRLWTCINYLMNFPRSLNPYLKSLGSAM